MKRIACAIGLALAALPAFAVSIVQQTTLTTQHHQVGNGSPYVTGPFDWTVNAFNPSLGQLSSVSFYAEILCSFSSMEVNPYEQPMQHAPGFLLTTSFYFPNDFGAQPLYLQANGDPMTLDPNNGTYTYTGILTGNYSFSGALGDYIGTDPLTIFASPLIFGLNENGSAMADVTINATLTYDYAAPQSIPLPTAVPDAGATILLVALGLVPLLYWSTRRREQRSEI